MQSIGEKCLVLSVVLTSASRILHVKSSTHASGEVHCHLRCLQVEDLAYVQSDCSGLVIVMVILVTPVSNT